MKSKLLPLTLLVSTLTFAQSWNITGNTGTNSSTNFIGTTDNQPLVFKANNTEGIRIKPNGNIGINFDSPQSRLTIYEGGAAGSNHFELRTNHLRNPDRYFMKNIIFGTGVEDVTFSLRHDGQMYVNGKAGIGTTNPDAKLHVAQDNINNQNLVLGKFTSFGSTGGSAIVSLTYNSTTANLEVNSTYSGNGFRYGTYGDFNIENEISAPEFGAINFITNKKIQMAIMPNGNASLQGKLEAKELKVTLTPTADFVFDEKYDLPKLEEVEKHIREKKHLPEIASARIMEKEGVNVGEFQIKLLQKIEELTLYSIDQNKQIKQQSDQLKQLQDENEVLKAQSAKIEKLEQQVQQLLSAKK
ncbi:hypothetical protein [Chryseobacterium sp. MEBOG07]|uniref:hypothetical protein n=1 Tax=Chryseobacterium sp. MEBOG07 TaxID=2879939 RepID=UPI001F38B96E|nr:hypothetical protein [Chryseobacterium sp. MEBOG07]UKB79290.1 hypothetical protein LF886_23185 [Chryseobacterium sp. MEBOG07]